jgi:hypothetical protein
LNLPKEPTSGAHARKRKPIDLAVPDWLPADAWRTWCDHRKAIGRKFTEHAQDLAIQKLDSLRAEGHDPRKLIDLAIESGWSSFNPRNGTLTNPGARPSGIRGGTTGLSLAERAAIAHRRADEREQRHNNFDQREYGETRVEDLPAYMRKDDDNKEVQHERA